MTKLNMKRIALSLALPLLSIQTASAETIVSDARGPGESDSKFVAGAQGGSIGNPFRGEGTEAYVIPNFEYRGERFFVDSGDLGLTVFRSNEFSGGIVLTSSYSFLADDDEYEDNSHLAGLKERDSTLDAGFYLMHTNQYGQLKLTVLDEITGEHGGQQADLKYTFDYEALNWKINPYIGIGWDSKDTVNHFYGVSDSESNLNRAMYNGKSTLSSYAGIKARYDITDHVDITLNAAYVHLGSGISDSSIIDEDGIFISGLGVNYNF